MPKQLTAELVLKSSVLF